MLKPFVTDRKLNHKQFMTNQPGSRLQHMVASMSQRDLSQEGFSTSRKPRETSMEQTQKSTISAKEIAANAVKRNKESLSKHLFQ